MKQKGVLDALIGLIETGTKREPQGTLPGLLEAMPEDLQRYCRALLNYDPPTLLSFNHWELVLWNEESTRTMLADAGGSIEASKHEHLITIAMEGGGLPAVAGFSCDGPGVLVYVLDFEYRRVERVAWSLRSWLRDRFFEGQRGELHESLIEIMGGPVKEVDFSFESVGQADFAALDRLPDGEVDKLLRASGHIGFRTSQEGTSVAIHQKGIRFVGPNGKRKAKGVKGHSVTAGSISEDGRYALVLNSYLKEQPEPLTQARLTRFALPGGEVKEYDLAGYWPDFAHLKDDHIFHAREGEVILYKMEEDALVEKQRMGTVDIELFAGLWSFYHGRLFMVIGNKSFLLGAFRDGDLRWIGRGSGIITDPVVHKGDLYCRRDYLPSRLTKLPALYD